MDNKIIIEENWTGVIIQWLFLFSLLALIYFIGWLFGRLAKKYNKKRWLYLILGIATFAVATYLGSKIESVIKDQFQPQQLIYSLSGYLRLPFALIITSIAYLVLERSWMNPKNPDSHLSQ